MIEERVVVAVVRLAPEWKWRGSKESGQVEEAEERARDR